MELCEKHRNLQTLACPVCMACAACNIISSRAAINAHLGDYRGALGEALEDNKQLAILVYNAIGLMQKVAEIFSKAASLSEDEALQKLIDWKNNGGPGRCIG